MRNLKIVDQIQTPRTNTFHPFPITEHYQFQWAPMGPKSMTKTSKWTEIPLDHRAHRILPGLPCPPFAASRQKLEREREKRREKGMMIPQQWASPCGSQCTQKYAALTQIPCKSFLILSQFSSYFYFILFFSRFVIFIYF